MVLKIGVNRADFEGYTKKECLQFFLYHLIALLRKFFYILFSGKSHLAKYRGLNFICMGNVGYYTDKHSK